MALSFREGTYTASRHPGIDVQNPMFLFQPQELKRYGYHRNQPRTQGRFFFDSGKRLWMPWMPEVTDNKGALLVERKLGIFNFQVLFPNDVCFFQYPTNRQTSHAVLRGGKRGFV